jgi:hypothetical protein
MASAEPRPRSVDRAPRSIPEGGAGSPGVPRPRACDFRSGIRWASVWRITLWARRAGRARRARIALRANWTNRPWRASRSSLPLSALGTRWPSRSCRARLALVSLGTTARDHHIAALIFDLNPHSAICWKVRSRPNEPTIASRDYLAFVVDYDLLFRTVGSSRYQQRTVRDPGICNLECGFGGDRPKEGEAGE